MMNRHEIPGENNQPTLEEENNNLAHYQVLMTRRQHIENIFWSRVQTLHAIQAAILASGFFLIEKDYRILSVAVFSFGAFLTFFLGWLSHNDWSDAAVNDSDMHRLGDILHIRRTADRRYLKKLLKGHRIMYILMVIFLAGDTALAILLSQGVNLLK